VLDKITKRITSEVPGINRVLYDLTPKPTGTIEFEWFKNILGPVSSAWKRQTAPSYSHIKNEPCISSNTRCNMQGSFHL